MMFWQRFAALLVTRNKEFLRDRSTLAWNILMPVLIVAGFAVTFTGDFTDQYKVGVAPALPAAGQPTETFFKTRYIEFIPVTDLQQAIVKVERHQLDMLLDRSQHRYWINNESPKGYLVEKILHAEQATAWQKQTVSGKEIRYVDWVIPGVLAMNMMFSALFGVGFVIVRYRKNGMLKRLSATPLTALEYLSAQVVSRLLLSMTVTIFVFYATDFFIGYAMHGSHLLLFLVFAVGTFTMICMGLLIAARVTSEETAGGLLNMLSWPMMFLSGVWFSLEGTNPIVQRIAEIFPLTHVTAAARAIMLDGAGLPEIGYHLIILLLQSVIFLIIGAWAFRWE
jgi:ABC-type multidrug transport system permease subunit